MITCNACGRKLIANTVRGHLQYRCRMKDEYPGLNHPKSLSVREDQPTPVIDGWLAQLFDNDHIDQTIETLTGVNLEESGPTEELAARREIRQIDKRIADFETALGLTEDPESLAGFTRRIEQARAVERRARCSVTRDGWSGAHERVFGAHTKLLRRASRNTSATSESGSSMTKSWQAVRPPGN